MGIDVTRSASELALPDTEFGPEWALLELVSRGIFTDKERSFATELLAATLDDQELFLQAMTHRIDSILAYYVDSIPSPRPIAQPFRRDLRRNLQANRHHMHFLAEAASEISEALTAAGVRSACTKGVVLAHTVYEDYGSRTARDIDFIVASSDVETVMEVMLALDYEVGEYDWASRTVRPLERAALIEYRLFPDHMPPFVKRADGPCEPYVNVDFAMSLTWHSSRWPLPVDSVLDDPASIQWINVDNIQLPALPPAWHFLRVVLHIFRETWLERAVRQGRDITLRKVADVARMWRLQRHELERADLRGIVETYGLSEPVVWVLQHVDHVVGTRIVDEMGLRKLSSASLSSARGDRHTARAWHGDMRRRLNERSDVEFHDALVPNQS